MCPTPSNRLPNLFSWERADEDDELVLMFPKVSPKVGNCDIRFRTKQFFTSGLFLNVRSTTGSTESAPVMLKVSIFTFPDILFIALRPSAARASANLVIHRTHVLS